MRLLFFISLLFFMNCNSNAVLTNENKTDSNIFIPIYSQSAVVLVYKTKADYTNKVPVLLNDEKTMIVSYPAPSDLFNEEYFFYPTALKSGYLLDNKGINKNVAFLNITYQEYIALKEPMTLSQMYDLIIDKAPLLELCNCGNKSAFNNIELQINELIENEKIRKVCKTII